MRDKVLSHWTALLAGLTAATSFAQVPFDYLVVSEDRWGSGFFRIVDPASGIATDIVPTSGLHISGSNTVAIDEIDPRVILAGDDNLIGGANTWRITLNNNHHDSAPVATLPVWGALERMHSYFGGVLFTLSAGAEGLHAMPSIGAAATWLVNLTDAADIAVLNGKAYVNSYTQGQPSTIVEVDLGTQATRVLGSNYATVRSIGTFSGSLLAGREDGDIDLIDTVTGAARPFLSTGKGTLIAIAEGGTGSAYVATAGNEVYSIHDFTTPVYVPRYPMDDIDVGRVDRATQLFYGSGCGVAGATPESIATPGPALGTTYSIRVENSEPSAPATVLIGLHRLSIALDPIGFAGCSLLVDPFTTVPTQTARDGTVSISMNMGNDVMLIGETICSQFFMIGSGSTLASSGGIEGQIR